MNLAELFPSKAALSGFQDIEKQLESRRYTSRRGLVIALVSVLVQVAVVLRPDWKLFAAGPFSKGLIPFYVALFAFTVYILFRYTGFLFKQSRAPFRYTFSINDFRAAASSPAESSEVARDNSLKLLRYDLTELLNRRVGRFSLLQSDSSGAATPLSKTSHFHIEGDYAIREEGNDNERILHVWPRVRIGAASNPFTLAFAVRFLLEPESPQVADKSGAPLGEDYERLVERVYSSITTEIYKQIEIDLRDKMTLFPTDSIRALARYTEAEDFETSNTIEAYDRALELYRVSLDELKSSHLHSLMIKLGRWLPVLIGWEWTGVRAAMSAEARSNLGHSRCLLYRWLVSQMAGRASKSIFVVRDQLDNARQLLTECYNAQMPGAAFQISNELKDAIETGHNLERVLAEFCKADGGRPNHKAVYRAINSDLCELTAVSALAYSKLMDAEKADRFCRFAEALALTNVSDRLRVLILLAKAELEPGFLEKVRFLKQATEINPQSEIALFRLAHYLDLMARNNEEITVPNVDHLSRAYEAVLKVNPGNMASLILQGYLYWLIEDLPRARRKLTAGVELQKVVSQTFVGDLKYCLARVEVERGLESGIELETAARRLMQAVFLYQEAVLADPTVTASYSNRSGEGDDIYYERMTDQTLGRFGRFKDRTLAAPSALVETLGRKLSLVQSYALNDYANACFNYYARFDIGTARREKLESALSGYQKAVELNRANAMTRYSWLMALTWADDKPSEATKKICADLMKDRSLLSDEALANVLSARAQWLNAIPAELKKLGDEQAQLKKYIDGRTAELEKLPERQKLIQELELKQPRQTYTRNQQNLEARTDAFQKEVDEVEVVASSLLQTSRLMPFRVKDAGELQRFLSDKTIDWSAYSDVEVSTLSYLANVWGYLPRRKPESGLLCTHILDRYYPEKFAVLQTLCFVSDLKTQRELGERIADIIFRTVPYDRDSNWFRYLLLQNCDQLASTYPKDSPDCYEQVLNTYNRGRETCSGLPGFQDSLAFAYEGRAKELGAVENGLPKALGCSQFALGARKEACKLDPARPEYRKSLLSALGRELAVGNTFKDPLSGRETPRLMEIDFAKKPTPDLGFSADEGPAIPAGLQEQITELRAALSEQAGFNLPFILFRRNESLPKGQFRVFIRGVPLPVYVMDESLTSPPQCWTDLRRKLEQVAREHAGRFYNVEECLASLRDPARSKGTGYAEIQSDPHALLALTLVLKTLLSEQVPIVGFASIVSEFRRCRKLGMGHIQTVEEVRSVPQVRKVLPGNSAEEDFEVINLPKDLESSADASVNWTGLEPLLRVPAGFPCKVREFAVTAKLKSGKRRAILVTSPPIRPFVAKACQGLDIYVLSSREILPQVLSRAPNTHADSATKATANAAS